MIADTSGIALGIIATTFAVRAVVAHRNMPQPRAVQPGLMALRNALPAGARTPQVASQPASSQPWLLPAVGIAIPIVALLIGGQILFPSQMYGLEKGDLKDAIAMDGSKTDGKEPGTPDASPHVAMRVPPNDADDRSASSNSNNDNSATAGTSKENSATTDSKDASKTASTGGKNASPPLPSDPTKQRPVKFLGGKITLDVYQHPIIGSPEAPHIVIEMASYDCPHCRKMSTTMQHALERYGDQVALLVMVIPMETSCNKLLLDQSGNHPGACDTAKLALGVSKLNPTAFGEFHEFLMSTKDKPPSLGAIRSKAYVLADRSQLRDLTQKDELAAQIERYVDLYGRLQQQNQGNKKFGLPVQILGDYNMFGEVDNEEEVFKAWEEHLGVKPR
jgi:protein-disulfide isomerase